MLFYFVSSLNVTKLSLLEIKMVVFQGIFILVLHGKVIMKKTMNNESFHFSSFCFFHRLIGSWQIFLSLYTLSLVYIIRILRFFSLF